MFSKQAETARGRYYEGKKIRHLSYRGWKGGKGATRRYNNNTTTGSKKRTDNVLTILAKTVHAGERRDHSYDSPISSRITVQTRSFGRLLLEFIHLALSALKHVRYLYRGEPLERLDGRNVAWCFSCAFTCVWLSLRYFSNSDLTCRNEPGRDPIAALLGSSMFKRESKSLVHKFDW